MRSLIGIALIVFLLGCASIDHTTETVQTLNTTLFAGVGDVIIKIDRERNLENSFGKADIFGRKTKEGYTEVRFAGIEPNGSIVLYRKDIDILTNETTMSRTPISTTTNQASTSVAGTANTYGNTTYVQGNVTTNHASTTVNLAEDFHIVVPYDTVAIKLDPGELELPVSGYIIKISKVTKQSLKYTIAKQGQ